ncbi:hypothetical protein SK571_40865 [Lentzea sp. BCCO 10_0798]|uniref:Uncharacterized protein n=1 Tax=Lentzea kristufekii TaxID=3095430 RepID=A0ABU4U6P0_9PSEU|nr:hypothetical protein [Lentzea sp. BCCO 10_0798]MDX8055767.1 hypothetical protein [Lentzea sp. BCCO 10_0798]
MRIRPTALAVLAANSWPFSGELRFVATCPTCHGRINPDQVMCTACALSKAAHA